MNIIKRIGKIAVAGLMWIVYALLLRPFVLLIEIIVAIVGFFADVVTFPAEYSAEMGS